MEQKYMEILLEQMSSQLGLVLEGHAALSAKIDGVEQRLDAKIEHNSFQIGVLNEKIDAVAADLSAHRRDTEAHRGYRVGE